MQAYLQGILGTPGKLMAEMSHPDLKLPPYEWPDGYRDIVGHEHLKAALDRVESSRKYRDRNSYFRTQWFNAEESYKSLYERASRETTSWDLSPDAPVHRVQVDFLQWPLLSISKRPATWELPFSFLNDPWNSIFAKAT